jgi:glycosyltransferase involved in cell wall biosynthesis
VTAKDLHKLPIAVSMTARNEAHNLPRCLDSVRDWVSEIVLVINDCTDRTRSVAEEYGARVFESPWDGFREQKNKSLSHVTHPWVLALDADEVVSTALRDEISAFFESDHKRYHGACSPRKVWFLGRWITHGDWYPDRVTRLFRTGKGRWVGSTEHCHVAVDGPIKTFSSDLLHYSNPDIGGHIRKIPYYADIFLERQLEENRSWSVFETVFRPWWRFFRAYVLRRGFLDGYPGYYIAKATAFATLVRYSRLYEHEVMNNKTSR